jgi:crossover junction endodeoxyribonuclease RusA
MARLQATVPLPPSLNSYYRHVGPRVLISRKGRAYRQAIAIQARQEHWPALKGPVHVRCVVYWPDGRRRDLDNYRKALYDALTHADVWEDDSMVVSDFWCKGWVFARPGKIEITIEEIE